LIEIPYSYHAIPEMAKGHSDAYVAPAQLAGYHIFRFNIPPKQGRIRIYLDFIVIEYSNKDNFKQYYLDTQIEQWLNSFTPGWRIFVWKESFDLQLPTIGYATAFRLKWLT